MNILYREEKMPFLKNIFTLLPNNNNHYKNPLILNCFENVKQ